MAKPLFPFPSFSGPLPTDDCRPTEVQHFVKHAFHAPQSDTTHSHTFAVCKWPQYHLQCQYIGKPVQIWCKSLYEGTVLNMLLPLDNITTQVISGEGYVNNESVLVVIPLCNN